MRDPVKPDPVEDLDSGRIDGVYDWGNTTLALRGDLLDFEPTL